MIMAHLFMLIFQGNLLIELGRKIGRKQKGINTEGQGGASEQAADK